MLRPGAKLVHIQHRGPRDTGTGMIGTKAGMGCGLFDQAIVSFGNFALNLMLARAMPVPAYGSFVTILSFVLLFNLIHQAGVTYPLSVAAAGASTGQGRILLGKAVLTSALTSLFLLAPLAIATASLGHISLLPIAFSAMLAWQLQETIRRGLLAQARFAWAIAQDGVRYLGPLAAVLVLHRPLASSDVYLLIFWASVAAVLPQLRLLGRPSYGGIADFYMQQRADWGIALPVVGATLLAAISTQWYLWILAWRHDVTGTAALAAIANVAALISPVMLGIENILVPEVARLHSQLSFGAMLRHLRGRSLLCGFLILPACAAVLLFPAKCLRLLYGSTTLYAGYPQALRLLVLAYVSYLASAILGATLRGYRAGQAAFMMQAYPAAFGLILGGWLTITWGLYGACAAALLTGLLRTAFGLWQLFALRSRHEVSATTAV